MTVAAVAVWRMVVWFGLWALVGWVEEVVLDERVVMTWR